MDKGSEIGLFAAALGIPLVLLFALLGSILAAALAFTLVVGLCVSFVVAGRLADKSRSESESDESPERNATDSLETLRDRYARGELTESEFERRVETVLDTESSRSSNETPSRADEDADREPEFDRA
ncbi:SHOCT domain-containing protein [Natrinema longum]|uniref:SHOCT domain-containing protein n=1 Tax=Natrinema longum TaxID=370324 RepID=A0A8A2UAT0_9EURY|nr:SHOCT domain-containing protein [Natrinema longum]MBZ6496164.1 SHOCT domain-containing protein [Natrinema longum]QSW85911.1 SHOCT domain-containing protein [Natrinema longum]